MRRLLALSFLITLLATPAVSRAGFGPDLDPKPMIVADRIESSRPDPSTQCVLAGGISRADVVARDAQILKEKFAKIPVGEIARCTFDGDNIAVERYAGVLVTTIGGKNRLVYDPSKDSPSLGSFDLVMPDMATWQRPNCPGGTAEWLVEEQDRRVFACYPEPRYHVTTRAEKEATRKAYAEQARWSSPAKKPGP